jgi:hypothetical protein
MTDDEKKQAAIDLLVSKKYPRFVAEAMVKIEGPDRILERMANASAPNSALAAKPKASDTHAEECGDVGETGDHGELGENAKA